MDSAQDIDYEKYEERLDTFNYWPKESPALIKELVDAGFYYSGESDLVTCFACGIQIGQWHEGDNPLEKHVSKKENCRYLAERAIRKAELQNLHSEGDSFLENSNDALECDNFGLDYLENRISSIGNLQATIPKEMVQAIAEAGIFYNRTSELFECYACHTQFDLGEILGSNDPITCHKEKLASCKHIAIVSGDFNFNTSETSATPKEPTTNLKTPKSQNEEKPTGDYQPSGFMLQSKVSDKAKQGGTKPRQNPMGNRLKLTMPMTVSRMQTSNVPHIATTESQQFNPEALHGYACAMPSQTIHQKYFDPQPGSASPDFSGNISPIIRMSPRVSVESEVLMLEPQISRQSSNWSMSSDDEMANHDFHANSPLQLSNKKAMLKTKYGRLQTFLTWPTDALIQPQELSEAGFYYIGEDDGVKCYVCGILLRNWELGDTAWNEHKRWKPSCPLVIEHDAQASSNDRHISNLENRQPIRRQFDRVQHNFYDMRNPPDVQYPVMIPPAPFPQFNGIPFMGYSNIFRPPFINGSQNLVEQNEFLRNKPLPSENSRNEKEAQEMEQIGPLAKIDFDRLLDAGFSVEVINKVQKLAHEKYGEYLDSVETVADAIVHFMENGNLDEHSLPKTSTTEGGSGEPKSKTSGRQLDLKRELDKVREMQLCKICMDEQVGVAFHPCGHLFTCPRCAEGLEQCPVCRANIESTSRVYLS